MLKKFLPFFLFILLFKFGAGLHYTLLSPLGESVFPVWIVGLVIGAASLLQLLLDVPAGFLLDRFGYVRLLKITTVVFLAAAGALFFGFTPAIFIATLVIGGFGWLFFGPGVDAYLLSQATQEHAGRFMALRDIFGSIGVVLAVSALAIAITMPLPMVAFSLLVILALALFALWLAPRDTVSVHAEQKLPTHHFYIRRHFIHHLLGALKRLNPASTMLILSNLSASIFYGTVWFVIPITIAHEAGSDLMKSVGLSIFDFAVVVLGFAIGRLADTWNRKWLVFIGLLLFGITGTFLGFNAGIWFIVLGFLATAGDEMASVSLWAWLHHLDAKHTEDALVAGVITLFNDLGWAIGPAVAGFLFALIGPSWTIAAGASFVVLSWIFYSLFVVPKITPIRVTYPFLHRPRRRRHKE